MRCLASLRSASRRPRLKTLLQRQVLQTLNVLLDEVNGLLADGCRTPHDYVSGDKYLPGVIYLLS